MKSIVPNKRFKTPLILGVTLLTFDCFLAVVSLAWFTLTGRIPARNKEVL